MTGLSLDNMQSNRIRCKCLGRFQVVRWYLSAFHAGRRSEVAKKPYNPIIGETFGCWWDVNDEATSTTAVSDGPVPWCHTQQLTFIAEQVSHHPPGTLLSFQVQLRYSARTETLYTLNNEIGTRKGTQFRRTIRCCMFRFCDSLYGQERTK